MALLLDNDAQARSVTISEAIEVLTDGIRQMALGDAIRRPRVDNLIPTPRPEEFFCFSSMEGGVRSPGYYALRIKPDIIAWPSVAGVRRRVTYNTRPGLYGGLVLLFDVNDAKLLAILNDGFIQHLRIGANAALGVKYLAQADASELAILGSGGMAHSFAEAFCAVRPIRVIRVYSPTAEHARSYAQEVGRQTGVEVQVCAGAEEAVRGAHIVGTCTNATVPVMSADWLLPGAHIANTTSWELGADTYARVDVAGLLLRRTPMSVAGYVDDDFGIRANVLSYAAGRPEERARIPTSSWVEQGTRATERRYPNARYVDCVDWKTMTPYRRGNDEEVTTLTNMSHGTLEGEAGPSAGIQGIQFVTIAGRIYENARRLGLGRDLPPEMFLQDVPT